MTDKQTRFDATMEALSGMVDDTMRPDIKATLNQALDLHRELRPSTWVERVKRKPQGRGR